MELDDLRIRADIVSATSIVTCGLLDRDTNRQGMSRSAGKATIIRHPSKDWF
jgi:hypothetical protein